MIEGMLNQKAEWKQLTGTNDYGESEYEDPVIIKVRWEGKRRVVRNKKGQEVVSEATIFCKEIVQEEDMLVYGGRACTVLSVLEKPGLDGRVWYLECYI